MFGIDDVIIGAIVTGVINAAVSERRNKQQRAEAQRQMEFQEQQTSTAYQRAMADMGAAGLNPMLAGKLGGAQSGAGAQASLEDSGAAGLSGASQALSLAQGIQSIKQSRAAEDQAAATAAKLRSETLDKDLNTAWRIQEVERSRAQSSEAFQRQVTEAQRPALMKQQEEMLKTVRNLKEVELDVANTSFSADVARRKAEARKAELGIPAAEAEAKFYKSDVGSYSPAIRQAIDVVRGVTSAVSAGRR